MSRRIFNFFKKKEIVSIEREDHLPTFLIIREVIDVLNDLGSIGVDNIFVDLACDQLAEVEFLLWLRGKVVGLGGQVVRVLVGHQMKVVLLDALNNLGSLHPVTILEQGLKNTASVMLKAQFVVLCSYHVEALLHDSMLLIISNLRLLLLDQKLVVVYLYFLYTSVLTLSFLMRSETFCFCLLFRLALAAPAAPPLL